MALNYDSILPINKPCATIAPIAQEDFEDISAVVYAQLYNSTDRILLNSLLHTSQLNGHLVQIFLVEAH